MKYFVIDSAPTTVKDGRAAGGGGVRAARLLIRARQMCQAIRQVFGIPDYERYLRHAAARHPGAPVLSRRVFFTEAVERKYSKSGSRCC